VGVFFARGVVEDDAAGHVLARGKPQPKENGVEPVFETGEIDEVDDTKKEAGMCNVVIME